MGLTQHHLAMPPFSLRPAASEGADFISSVYEVTARPLVEGIVARWAEAKMREKHTWQSNYPKT